MKTNWELFCHQKHSKVAIALRTAGGRAAIGITRATKNRFWLSLLTVLLALSSHRGVQAAEILRQITTFTGLMESFDFDVPAELVGGMVGDPDVTLTTGPITLSLDPAGGVNLFGLDDVTGTGSIDVTLIADFPLLAMLMEPPPSIRIVEAGMASVMDCMGTCPPNDFTFTADLTGGGTIADGGLFTGTTFSNVNTYLGEGINSSWLPITPPDITWSLSPNSGQVTFPPLLGGQTVTGLNGSGTLTLVPEPTAVTLSLLGVLGLVGYRRIARRIVARRHLD